MPFFILSTIVFLSTTTFPREAVKNDALPPLLTYQKEEKDAFDKMVLDPTLKTFVSLIVKAGMVEAFKVEGPITIFAPNNAAFERLPLATLESLKRDKALLRKTLSFHIVTGKLLTKEMKEGPLKTLLTDMLTIKLRPGLTPTINGTRMMTPDIESSNGTMHVVGVVFIPPVKPIKTP
jgi:uncharacterized surface protein with fasciclin (FAS1) repeats